MVAAHGRVMPTLQALLRDATWPPVEKALRSHYPGDERSLERFRRVFEFLREMAPVASTLRIHLEWVEPEDPAERSYVDVHGRDGEQEWQNEGLASPSESDDPEWARREVRWGLSLAPWNEWLGMTIDPEDARSHTDAEILAHCLWEMTFHGFDEVTIAAKGASMARGDE